MILQALHRLAEKEGLVQDPDYEPKPVAWVVRVSASGQLLGMAGTHTVPPPEGKRRARPQPKRFMIPRQPIRTSGDRAYFLCDKSEYALGADPQGRRAADKLEHRSALFRREAEACLEATGDEGVGALVRLLKDIASGAQKVDLPAECAPNDLVAFVYSPDVDRLVLEGGKGESRGRG
jgi:CRISPR-associated protein Csd1